MSNRLPGSTGKLTLGSVEPGSGLGKSRQKTGAGRGKGKKGKQNGERNEPWSQERTLVNLIQNTKSTRLVRGEQGSKRVKLNINNNIPKTIKATGVLLINRTDKETFSFWGFNVETGAPNDNFRKNICSEDDFRSRIFGTFVVKILACLPLL